MFVFFQKLFLCLLLFLFKSKEIENKINFQFSSFPLPSPLLPNLIMIFIFYLLWSLDTHYKSIRAGLVGLVSCGRNPLSFTFVSPIPDLDDPLTLSAGPFFLFFCPYFVNLNFPTTFLIIIFFFNFKRKLVIDSSYYLACFYFISARICNTFFFLSC